MLKALLLLLLSVSPQFLMAQSFSVDNPEIEVQRREFETHLYNKLDRAISQITKKKTYIISVGVSLKPIPPETLDLDYESNEEFPLTPTEELTAIEGLVPLSKLGYWKKVGLKKGRKITKKTKSFFEYVSGISVDILLDNLQVDEEQKAAVQSIVSIITQKSSPIPPEVKIESMQIFFPEPKIKKDPVQQALEEKEKAWRLEEWISALSIPVSLIIATSILFLLGLLVSMRYTSFQKRKLQLDEDREKRAEERLRQEVMDKDKLAGLDEDSPKDLEEEAAFENEKLNSGFGQFLGYLKSDVGRAIYLIKQWIHLGSEESKVALATLPRLMTVEELNEMTALLSEADRKIWIKAIAQPTDSKTYYIADRFVARQITSSVITPPPPVDDETKELLATVSPEEGARLLKQDPQIGILLINVLPSLQMARIFGLLDADIINNVASASATMSSESLSSIAVRFKQVYEKVRSSAGSQSSAFLEKAPDIIREVGFKKEAILFDNIAKTKNVGVMVKLAKEFFPAELIVEVPPEVLKIVLETMPLSQRAELIFSQSEEYKNVLFNAIGQSGRVREIVETEIEEIEANEGKSRLLQRNSDRLWQDFLDRFRKVVRKDVKIQDEVFVLIESWVTRKSGVSGVQGVARAA